MLIYQASQRLSTFPKTEKCQLEESNLRPSLYEGDALPTELSWHKRKDVDPTINILQLR